MAFSGYINLPVSGNAGIVSINSNTTAAQLIVGGSGISVVSSGGTTTISNTAVATDSFVIMQTPLGTSPTATSPSDTLTFANTDGYLDITGNSVAKSITFNIDSSLITLVNSKVSSVAGTSPIASSGGTAPNISISQATTSTDGYLSSTDWNTFNNKQPAGSYITSVSGTSPIVSSGGTTPAISIPQANGSTNGYLSSTDWTTFNNKGSVSSVALATPGVLYTVSGSPVTSSGTLTLNLVSQAANIVFAGPSSGASAAPTFRSLVVADLPASTGQSFITSGTAYTTPSNINTNTNFKFTIIGGGGGGAGANSASSGGCGGGAGGSLIVWVTGLSPSTTYTIAIGAAGTAGTNTASSGGGGGTTTLTIGATTYTARGGSGGGVGTTGGAGGTCTNGTLNITGQRGDDSDGASVSPGTSGGNSILGFGGGYAQGGSGAAVTGYAATGYGGGGGGGAFSGGTKAAGGAGTQGCILVQWSV